MKMKHAFATLATLAITLFVATALAQDFTKSADGPGRTTSVQDSRKSADGPAPTKSQRQPATNPKGFISPVYQSYVANPAFQTVNPGSVGDIYGNNIPRFFEQSANPALQKLGAEEAQLANDADGLIRELANSSSEGRINEIKKRLDDILAKQFDARQKRHELEIEALEAKVKKLKDLVNKRQESRDEIITRRLEQIVRDSQGLGW